MPVYSKIQQIRDAKRETTKMETEKTKRIKRIVSLSPRFGKENRWKIQQHL